MEIMSLSEINIVAKKRYTGQANMVVSAGQSLVFESSPNGLDILNETCPEGKTWKTTVTVDIVETDA